MTTTSSVQNLFTSILRRDGTTEEVANFVAVINGELITLAEAQKLLIESTEASQFVDPVIRLYQSAFDRQPESTGFDFNVQFLRDGGTINQLSDAFVVSTEFTNLFGTGTTVDSAFVAGLYQFILNRFPVVSEIDAWISTGEDRGGVLRGFSESPEYIVNSQADVDRLLNNLAIGIPLDPTKSLPDEASQIVDPVIRLYQSAFGRQPDSDGFDVNVQFLRDGGTVEQLSAAFTVTAEFTNRFGTSDTVDSAYLTALFLNVLGRTPTDAEVDAWIATGEDRGGVLRGFSESPEYIVNSQADVDRLLNNVASGIPLDPTKSLAETPGGPIANLGATASILVAENSTMVTDGFDGTDTPSNIGGVDGSLFDDEEGDDTLIQLDANDSVTLIGVSLGDLNSGDVLI